MKKCILNLKTFKFLVVVLSLTFLVLGLAGPTLSVPVPLPSVPARKGVDIGEWFRLKEGVGIGKIFGKDKCYEACCNGLVPPGCSTADEKAICESQCAIPLGAFISAILPNVYTIAGVILVFLLIFGGFTYIMNAGKQDTEGIQKGKNAITAALLGFGLIFGSWWIIQIVEIITGMDILK